MVSGGFEPCEPANMMEREQLVISTSLGEENLTNTTWIITSVLQGRIQMPQVASGCTILESGRKKSSSVPG